jgi:CRP-like cAMP-binding protein
MLEREICCIEESRYDLIALTAEERYEKLLTQTPQLLQQIPLYYLAALLGITPRHLSRIRAGQRKRN